MFCLVLAAFENRGILRVEGTRNECQGPQFVIEFSGSKGQLLHKTTHKTCHIDMSMSALVLSCTCLQTSKADKYICPYTNKRATEGQTRT